MSLLKTNEIQNYNGSSLTLTASTVSTSAQLNTGGNISVTGSLNVSDDSTTRTNLGLGTISTQDASNVNLTGGTIGSSVVFPTGNCIAIHTTTSNASQSTTSGDNTFTFGTVTTQKNNSKIVCSVSTKIFKVAGSIDVCIFQGTGLTGATTQYMKLQSNINSYSTGFFTGTMNSTTTLTIQARVIHDFYSGGSGTVTIGDSSALNTFITVWEFMP